VEAVRERRQRVVVSTFSKQSQGRLRAAFAIALPWRTLAAFASLRSLLH
jgi:hypothetical protein